MIEVSSSGAIRSSPQEVIDDESGRHLPSSPRVGFLAILMIMLYHRLRSWESKEPLDRRQEGLFILATLRPIGLAKIIPSMWFSIEPQATSPVPEWNGQRVRLALEEDMTIDAADANAWALRRQTEFHLVK